MSRRVTGSLRTPMLCVKPGSTRTVPGGSGPAPSAYTGTRSMPIGDVPGRSDVNAGSIGARQ